MEAQEGGPATFHSFVFFSFSIRSSWNRVFSCYAVPALENNQFHQSLATFLSITDLIRLMAGPFTPRSIALFKCSRLFLF